MSIGQSVTLETLEHKQTHRENEKMTGTGTKSLAKAISAAHKQGKSYRDIAGQLGISQSVVIIAIRKQEAKIAAMQKARRLDETQADTKLQPYQVVGISDESKSGQSPSNIAETLGIPVHDVKRILKQLDGNEGNEGNLGRVVCVETHGQELYDAVTKELRDDNRTTLASVYGLSSADMDAIEQSLLRSSGPSESDWNEACRMVKIQRATRKQRKIEAWAIYNEAAAVICELLPGCNLKQGEIITRVMWDLSLPFTRIEGKSKSMSEVAALANQWIAAHLGIKLDKANLVRRNLWRYNATIPRQADQNASLQWLMLNTRHI